MNASTTYIDLLRHGEPQGGHRFRGSLDDPLSDTGWAQLQAATADQSWDRVVCSPLRRCREFAQDLAARLGVACTVEPDFREISFGSWEGLTATEVQARYGEALTRFWQDPVRHPPPCAESAADFSARVDAAWQRLIADTAGQRVLVVAHGGTVAMLLRGVLGMPISHAWRIRLGYAGRARLRLDHTEHGLLAALLRLDPGG
ncbi:MAG: alpha-ribazole phosphatase family protein [Immundisolibacter sp.]